MGINTDASLLDAIFDNSPSFIGLLDKDRKFLRSTKNFITCPDGGNNVNHSPMLPGELFECAFHTETPNGCGSGYSCQFCGVKKLLDQAIHKNSIESGETGFVSSINSKIRAWNFKIDTQPLILKNQQMILVFIQDATPSTEKKMLERVFFHDVLNSATSLDSLVFLFTISEGEKREKYASLVKHESKNIIEQIYYHRQLIAAEYGDHFLSSEPLFVKDLAEDIIHIEQERNETGSAEYEFILHGSNPEITTNRIVLRRIILNLIKNAKEADNSDNIIAITIHEQEEAVGIDVVNTAVIPENVQASLFKKAFSTKGTDRGFGTYGIKLLTTEVLNGTIRFESNKENGTVFTLTLPKIMSEQ